MSEREESLRARGVRGDDVPHEDRVERYELLGELATGGMATVYLGRQRGQLGFSRTVAVKSMHPQFAKDETFRAMFIDEANLTARIRHPNVVPTLDIVATQGKLLLVMEYVEGVSLSMLSRALTESGKRMPIAVVSAIVKDLLDGLSAAHGLTDEAGVPLHVVHRDVSPQNVLVGTDGLARILDFGVAKASGRSHRTQTGEIKGKVGYMAPEQLFGEAVDRRADIYAAGVVLWEALAGKRLFEADNDASLVLLVTKAKIEAPSKARGEKLPEGLDGLVTKALAQAPDDRFATASQMAERLAAIVPPAPREEVGRVVRDLAKEELEKRASYMRRSSVSLSDLEPEAKSVLDVLSRAAMTRDALPTTSARREKKSVVFPVVLAIATGAALVMTTITFVRSGREVAPAAAAPPATAAADEAKRAQVAAPAEAKTDPKTEPATSAEPAPPASAKRPVWRKPKDGKKAADGTAAPAGAKPDCTPPYTVDADGSRHYKAECLP